PHCEKGDDMKRKWPLMAVPIIAACAVLASCDNNKTTTTPGVPTAFVVVRMTPTGAKDATFAGGNGIVTTPVDPALFAFALAVAIQPADGKILAAGSNGLAGEGSIALVRYTPAGALDTGFGTGGIVKTPIPSVASLATAVAVQPDGKIL